MAYAERTPRETRDLARSPAAGTGNCHIGGPAEHMFSALTASASGVVSDRPPHSTCSARPVVPDILHRVWIGNGCPAVRDFISLLSAALLLEPRRLHYWVSNPSWESRCAMTVGGKRVALPEIAECHAALGVRFRHLNLSDAAHPFVRATKHFSIHRRYKGGVGQINPIQQTDLLRGWIMRAEGGYYFDSDVFIVGGGLRHFRHCPTVLGSNALDFFDFTTSVPGTPPERTLAYLEAQRNGHDSIVAFLSTDEAWLTHATTSLPYR